MARKEDTHFVVTYRNPEKLGENVTVNVRKISDSSLGLTFVSLSDFVFGNRSPIVDPNEDSLRQRFQNTKSLHLSIYNIVSVEEVGEENSGMSLAKDKSNIVFFNPDKPTD